MQHLGDPNKNDGDMQIDVNSQGQEPTVAPGQTNVKWHWWGSVWTAAGTCNLVTQVIGIEDTPLHTDWPYSSCKEYPGWPFDYTKYFTAPTQEGSYRIFGIFCPVNTKDEAIQYYLTHPELRFQVGTLSVTSAQPSPPVAIFTKTPEGSVAGGENVHFNASPSYDPDGSIIACDWDFGDGTYGSGVTVDHAWSVVGIYTIVLTVTDNDGLTNWASDVVTVATPGVAISGVVVDAATSMEIPKVLVTADGYSAVTRGDGTFLLAVSGGTYTLTFSKEGYESVILENVDASSSVDLSIISLTPSVVPECYVDADCPEGFICQSGKCVSGGNGNGDGGGGGDIIPWILLGTGAVIIVAGIIWAKTR